MPGYGNDRREGVWLGQSNRKAVTESEAAADALGETLYNIGLEDLYDREDALDDEGHWIARFTLKPEEMQD